MTAAVESLKQMIEDGQVALPERSAMHGDRAEAIEYGFTPWAEPHRLTWYDYARAIPGFAERVRRVPALAVAEVGDDEEGSFAMVTCPCGGHPIARDSVDKCSGCERYYALVRKTGAVVVFYGNMDLPARA